MDDAPDEVTSMLIDIGLFEHAELLREEGCRGIPELVNVRSLKELNIKHFHAHAIAEEAKKRMLLQSGGSAGAEDSVEDFTNGETKLVERSTASDDFRPASWDFVLKECKRFEEYKTQTGNGRDAFIKKKQKPYSERALRRWKKEWLPVVTDEEGELFPEVDDFSVCPKGVRRFKQNVKDKSKGSDPGSAAEAVDGDEAQSD